MLEIDAKSSPGLGGSILILLVPPMISYGCEINIWDICDKSQIIVWINKVNEKNAFYPGECMNSIDFITYQSRMVGVKMDSLFGIVVSLCN